MSKLKIAVLYGGRSGEHEVSLESARSVIEALDKNRYEIIPIKITKDGHWEGSTLIQADPTKEQGIDVVFPVLHGPYGEDGTIQGLLELANLPYVGASVASSGAAMDKAFMRALFAQASLPLVPWQVILQHEWKNNPIDCQRELEEALGYPMFVKPANLGSSVGISKVKSPADLLPAMELAFSYDRKVVVEQAVLNAREIECSVLGHNEPQASSLGEIVPAHDFYDYQAKYHNEKSKLIIPAPLDLELAKTIQEYACQVFKAVDCSGMARVDFFIDEDGDVFVNEINTIPGFTQISMYPKLWEESGLPYATLLDRLIELALEKHQERQILRTSIF